MRRHLRTSRFRLLPATAASVLLVAAFSSSGVTASSITTGADALAASPKKKDHPKLDQEAKLAIVDQYVAATRAQQEFLRGAQMEVEIEAKLPSLEKHGKMRALRRISKLGQITYKALGFSGDNTVKQEVISRYLSAEIGAHDIGAIAITPANYKFRYAGRIIQGGHTEQIVEVTPRKKAVGLFKGEVWIDADTGMPIRESGQFVKNPSVFLKKIAFVRYYEMRDGVAVPARIESTVDTRIVGRAELAISFTNFSRPAAEEDGKGAAISKLGGAPSTRVISTRVDLPGIDLPGATQSGVSEPVTQPDVLQPGVTVQPGTPSGGSE